jgi:hypothetical protein
MLGIVFIVIIFVCVAMMWTEGCWSNALSFVNVVFASMVAMNGYEMLAGYFEGQLPGYTHVWDFLSIWGVFWLAIAVLRAVTDAISKHQVRFKAPVETAGNALFALATAWVFVCFTCATLHMAPLAQTAFRGSFAKTPMTNHFFFLSPDRLWLGYTHSRTKEGGALYGGKPFDKDGEFLVKFAARRKELEEHNKAEGTIGVSTKKSRRK